MDTNEIFRFDTEQRAKLAGEWALFEERVRPERLKEAIESAFDWQIKRAHVWHERLFKEYKLAALKGLPFKEREKLVDRKKLVMVERGTRWLEAMRKQYKIRPVSDWMKPGDYADMKRLGLRKLAQMYLTEMIDTPVKYPLSTALPESP